MKTKTAVVSKSTARKSTAVATVATALPQGDTFAFAYASLLVMALDGVFGPLVTRFYDRAHKYHKVEQTTFPRAKYAHEPLLNIDAACAKLEQCRATGIENGFTWSRRLYDEMRVSVADSAVVAAIKARAVEYDAEVAARIAAGTVV